MFIVVLKILFRLSLNFSSHLHFIVCFDCSFESMSQLCQRYNRAIDGILQLVSKVHIVYKYFFKPRCLTLARGKIKAMFFLQQGLSWKIHEMIYRDFLCV